MQNLAEGQIFKEVFPIETTPKKNVHQKFFFEAEACSEMGTYWDRSLTQIVKGFFFFLPESPLNGFSSKFEISGFLPVYGSGKPKSLFQMCQLSAIETASLTKLKGSLSG